MHTNMADPRAGSGSSKIGYIVNLSQSEVAEIETARETFKATEAQIYDVSAETFPLPTVGPRLEAIARNLHEGTGFALLHGLDPAKYSNEDNITLFLGLGSHIGSQRGAQNKNRNMISHITDAKEWQNVPPEKRHGIHTNSALPFHTDMGCEILVLQYRRIAAEGGATSLASAAAIYNDLLKQPEILKTLEAAEWPVQLGANPLRMATMPLLAHYQGHVIISADPGRLGLHPATAEKRSEGCYLTELQLRALKVLNDLAEKHAVSIPAQAGDILFINNLSMLHKRDSYVDADDKVAEEGSPAMVRNGIEENTLRRWLTRLWLRNESLSWEIPEDMKIPWQAAYGSVGRLIPARYDVSPEKQYEPPKYTAGTAAWLIEDDDAQVE
ncbi:hypothetical protein N8I77_006757 [Diaporthe amygdali]|uniref:TauD/TfdA-like domain-containing protein n=1 Tax=Phomopsis amygdali TaxID=1214568 RepID=A0AAD9W4W4_PHOAM|nr:hypothetical protein N8I77_006757 [Diaporthe amygdali]